MDGGATFPREAQPHAKSFDSPSSPASASQDTTKHSTESSEPEVTKSDSSKPIENHPSNSGMQKSTPQDGSPLHMRINLPSTSDPTPAFPPPEHGKLPASSREHLDNIILVDADVDAACIEAVLADLPPDSTNVAPVSNLGRTLHYVYCSTPEIVRAACDHLKSASLPCVTYQNWYVCVMTNVSTGDVRALMNADFNRNLRPYVRICEYDKLGPLAHVGKPSDLMCRDCLKLHRVLVAEGNAEKLRQQMVTMENHTFVGPFPFYEATGNQLSSLHECLVMPSPRYVREFREAQYRFRPQDTSEPLLDSPNFGALPDLWVRAREEASHYSWAKSQKETPEDDDLSDGAHGNQVPAYPPILRPDEVAAVLEGRVVANAQARAVQEYAAVAQAQARAQMYAAQAAVVQAHAIQAYAEAHMQAQHVPLSEQDKSGRTDAWDDRWVLTDTWSQLPSSQYAAGTWHSKDGVNKRNPNHPIPPAKSGVKGKKGERVDAACHPKYHEMQAHAKHNGPVPKGQEFPWANTGKGSAKGSDEGYVSSSVGSHAGRNSEARRSSDDWNSGSWYESRMVYANEWKGQKVLDPWRPDAWRSEAWKGRKASGWDSQASNGWHPWDQGGWSNYGKPKGKGSWEGKSWRGSWEKRW